MFEEIDLTRRGFSSTLAMTLAAVVSGLVRGASAQSKTPSPPAVRTGEYFPGFSTELIKTSGTTIHVLRKGTGRPLLLLHGYPETHLTWHKVAPRRMIAARAWRTVSVSIIPRVLKKLA
jgi:hypothetical protein